MYTREQASKVRQEFWTRFGKYMAPIQSAEGGKPNWVNYKTGIPNLYFRMNASKESASVAIEIMHRDPEMAAGIYQQFVALKPMLEAYTGEQWNWENDALNEHGQQLSRIFVQLDNVNIFKETDWPSIISFLKPSIIALDGFWSEYKMVFEMLK
ncbi:MAG: DUF4268 domain-containing protein [Chitinophagaceae bacterium]|nr:MAG: DUF4268 domain-containing protein [Chitinophagaceae bacterium]